MKILVLSDDFPPDVLGGAGVIAFRLTKEIVRHGHTVRVLATTTERETVGTSNVVGIEVKHIFSKYHERWRSYVSLWNPGAIREVKKVLREFKPDVVHAHNIHAHFSYAALRCAKKAGAKVFVTAHDIMPVYPGTFTAYINPSDLSYQTKFNYRVNGKMMRALLGFRYNPLRNFFIRYSLRQIDGVIAVSEALKDALVQNNIPVRAVIHNGIDAAAWQVSTADVEQFKKAHNILGRDVILFGGRLSGAKGGELILRALKTIVENNKNVVLLVAGRTGAYSDKMKRRAAELGIADHLFFTGWLDENESKKAYAAATVVTVPSVCFDSFPTNNLEAFAARKPVVATCFGGSREVVRDGENGHIVNPFDVPSLAAALCEFLTDADKATRAGAAGYELVARDFTLEAVARQYLSLFTAS